MSSARLTSEAILLTAVLRRAMFSYISFRTDDACCCVLISPATSLGFHSEKEFVKPTLGAARAGAVCLAMSSLTNPTILEPAAIRGYAGKLFDSAVRREMKIKIIFMFCMFCVKSSDVLLQLCFVSLPKQCKICCVFKLVNLPCS